MVLKGGFTCFGVIHGAETVATVGRTGVVVRIGDIVLRTLCNGGTEPIPEKIIGFCFNCHCVKLARRRRTGELPFVIF
jgi:hypothetical protein